MSGDDELAVLLALDALRRREQVEAELRHGVFPRGMEAVTLALAEAVASPPPDGLRARTLAHALSRRPAGRPVDGVTPRPAGAAFEQTIRDLYRLLQSLSPAEWDTAAHPEHGRVRDLIAHLVGMERLALRWLDPRPAEHGPVLPDHVAATRATVAELADLDPREVARLWHEAALAVATLAATGDPARAVPFHDLTLDVDGFRTMRTFELWAHGLDICAAVGRPPFELDAERMAQLATRLMAAVPFALAYRGVALPGRTARFVLTGPAGGTYTVPLAPDAASSGPTPTAAGPAQAEAGPAPAETGTPTGPTVDDQPDVLIVGDAVRLCLLAARRLTPVAVGASVEGDDELGALLLANLDAFARD